MKKFLSLLALLLPLFVSAQITYHHYLDSTSVWYEYHSWGYISGCTNGGFGEKYIQHHVIGWDSIAGEAWYLIHEDWESEWHCTGGPMHYDSSAVNNVPAYRIREDTLGNIWTYELSGPQKLLYAFDPNLAIGDTLKLNDGMQACHIASIDTLYLGNAPRKKYWCDCSVASWDQQFVVEGVGYNKKLNAFASIFCTLSLDDDFRTVCYQMNGETLVVSPGQDCGRPGHNHIVAVAPTHTNMLSLRWSALGEHVVIDGPDLLQDFHWQAMDALGRTIKAGQGKSEQIDLPGLAAGMYLFTLTTEAGRRVLRFVVN